MRFCSSRCIASCPSAWHSFGWPFRARFCSARCGRSSPQAHTPTVPRHVQNHVYRERTAGVDLSVINDFRVSRYCELEMSSTPHTLLTTPRRLAPVSLREIRPGWGHRQTAVASAVCAGRVDALVYWFELDNGPRYPGGVLNTGPKSSSHWCQVGFGRRSADCSSVTIVCAVVTSEICARVSRRQR